MSSIYSHIISFAIGLSTGVFGTFIANRLSDKAKSRDAIKERKKEFNDIYAKMPDLIVEMKNDLRNPEMSGCREFFISPSKSVKINTKNPAFLYFENEHENLKSKIRILENAGFVFDITPGNAPKYQFVEEFVEYLIK